MTDCLIAAESVLTGRGPDGRMTVVENATIRVQNGIIAEIGATVEIAARHPDLPRHGGPQMVAMPGPVNGHHHFGLTPLMAGVPFAPLNSGCRSFGRCGVWGTGWTPCMRRSRCWKAARRRCIT